MGYRWFAQGMRGGNASSFDAVPAMSNIVSPVMPRVDRVNAPLDMELQGWERDFHPVRQNNFRTFIYRQRPIPL
ncbi:MAG: hypothetical protein L6Q71_06840 [Planctomycetes bacterium]|nr:hypothetical protein [Planctomycetota bacterium]